MTKQSDRDWRQQVLNSAGAATTLTPAPTAIVTAPTPLPTAFPGPPSIDPIELLPLPAAHKLRMLRQRSADMHALCVPFEDIREATNTKLEAERQLKRLIYHPQFGGFGLPQSDARAVSAEKQVSKASDDLRRLQERSEMRSAAWQSASQALACCEAWLRDGQPHDTMLEAIEVEPPRLNKGESIPAAIERLRRRGRELRADQHRVRSAPYPSAYAKQRMREQIEALAMRGAPSVSALVELDGKIEFQTHQVRSTVYDASGAVAFAEVPDAIALTCWLHKSGLIAALDREIASETDDKSALTIEAREQVEAESVGDLIATERDICSLIWRGQAERLPVEFPADISPLALLGLRLITAPRGETRGSSAAHGGFNLIGGAR
jgi:hypothetical protein